IGAYLSTPATSSTFRGRVTSWCRCCRRPSSLRRARSACRGCSMKPDRFPSAGPEDTLPDRHIAVPGWDTPMPILVLTPAEVARLLPMRECITLMSDALSQLARGQAHQPLRMIIRPPQAKGLLALMPAHLAGPRTALGVKALSLFPSNPSIGKDAHQGSVLLYDNDTGELRALINASAITAIRTAAVSGVATRALAREEASVLALIGAGVEARTHLEAMASVRPLQLAPAASLRQERAEQFAKEMAARFHLPFVPSP